MIPRYRAWHCELGVMMSIKNMWFQNNMLEELELNNAAANDYITAYPDEVELMQSTGLTDKNGKEIFEGDILSIETDEEKVKVEVSWDNKHALFVFESKKYDERESLGELFEDNTYPFKIIGNVYENPELAEVKQ